MLSDSQIEFFKQNGYLFYPEFFSTQQAEALKSRMQDLITQHKLHASSKNVFSTLNRQHEQNRKFLDSGNTIDFFFEEEAFDANGRLRYPFQQAINKAGHALHEYDPLFKNFSHNPLLQTISHQLGIQQAGLVQSMYIFKQAGIGGEVCYHQDSTFIYGDNSDAIGFWFALEDATQENGCLEVIPSPVNTPLKSRLFRKNYTTYTETYDESPWNETYSLPLEAPTGSLIILHGRLPHKSCANRSQKTRQAYTLHMVDITRPFPKTNWIQWPEGIPTFTNQLHTKKIPYEA